MDLTVVQILLLSQGGRSLEEHTESLLDLVHLVNYDDNSLCVLFRAGLNTQTKACLLRDDPLGTFIQYVDCVLLQNGSSFNVGKREKDLIASTVHPTPF